METIQREEQFERVTESNAINTTIVHHFDYIGFKIVVIMVNISIV